MFSSARPSSRQIPSFIRSLTTESIPHTPNVPPPPPILDGTKPRPTRLHPQASARLYPSSRPRSDGIQLLPVPNSTRALLEDIVNSFEAPIRYAFAYGSGVFEQAGYDKPTEATSKGTDGPMLDFVFAVTHPDHWHSINMHQYPGHYPLHARAFGSSFVSRVQGFGPGLWFNTYVPMHGVPIRIIRDDARVRLTQQVNLTFTQRDLISYSGDPRMVLPAENRGKVANMVERQEAQFHELYWRLAQGLPGVRWRVDSQMIEQDASAHARAAHLKKLPEGLLTRVHSRAKRLTSLLTWLRVAGDAALPSILRSEMSNIVRYPATVQSFKGVVSAGLTKSVRYTAAKVRKYWKGSRTNASGES
ncbi:Mmp37-domain-containing protein [Boletus coccyginus]|nr:Mmp37-domain-containing protein [Boletus coccyginus]